MDSVVAEVRNANIFWQPIPRAGIQEFLLQDVIRVSKFKQAFENFQPGRIPHI